MNKARATLAALVSRVRHRLRSERGSWMDYINWAIGIGAAILIGAGVYTYVVPAINKGVQSQTTCFFGSDTGSVSTSCQQAPSS